MGGRGGTGMISFERGQEVSVWLHGEWHPGAEFVEYASGPPGTGFNPLVHIRLKAGAEPCVIHQSRVRPGRAAWNDEAPRSPAMITDHRTTEEEDRRLSEELGRSRVHELARLSLTGLVGVWNGLNDRKQNHGPAIIAIASCGDRDRLIAAIRSVEDPR